MGYLLVGIIALLLAIGTGIGMILLLISIFRGEKNQRAWKIVLLVIGAFVLYKLLTGKFSDL